MSRPHVSPQALARSHERLDHAGVTLWVHRDWTAALPVDAMLAGAPLAAWGVPLPHDLRGRGAVSVLDTPRGAVVAKALLRGGVIGWLLRHWYADPLRCAREALLAEELVRRGCPTPTVVAARARRGMLGLHRLEIASARLDGARDLLAAWVALAPRSAARRELARAAGRTLRRLHDEGLVHRDLQVKNLLVPGDLAPGALLFVLDLDRSVLGAPLGRDERVRSLARFGRSLVKRGLLPGGPVPRDTAARATGADVRAFLGGYGALPGAGRAAIHGAVAVRLAREVRWHRWLWSLRPSATGA